MYVGTDTEFALSKSLHVIVNITKLMNSLDVHVYVHVVKSIQIQRV